MDSEELRNLRVELEPLRAARVPLEAVRWTHRRNDGPIGLVTGPLSRARADFARGLKQSARFVRVEFFLARLADPGAVAAAIRRAKDAPDILLIAVCRGGGEEQELAVFSHPDVVRAVAEAASVKPVVTGIGHTEDHYLADEYATTSADLPYAAGEVIHQARQAAWRRQQTTRASATHVRVPFRRRTTRPHGIAVKLLIVGVLGILLAAAFLWTDRLGSSKTSSRITPARQHAPPAKQAPTKKRGAASAPTTPPPAQPKVPEMRPATAPQPPGRSPTTGGDPRPSDPAPPPDSGPESTEEEPRTGPTGDSP